MNRCYIDSYRFIEQALFVSVVLLTAEVVTSACSVLLPTLADYNGSLSQKVIINIFLNGTNKTNQIAGNCLDLTPGFFQSHLFQKFGI